MHEILIKLRIKTDGGPGDVYDVVNCALGIGVLQYAIDNHDHEASSWDMHVEGGLVEWPAEVR